MQMQGLLYMQSYLQEKSLHTVLVLKLMAQTACLNQASPSSGQELLLTQQEAYLIIKKC